MNKKKKTMKMKPSQQNKKQESLPNKMMNQKLHEPLKVNFRADTANFFPKQAFDFIFCFLFDVVLLEIINNEPLHNTILIDLDLVLPHFFQFVIFSKTDEY